MGDEGAATQKPTTLQGGLTQNSRAGNPKRQRPNSYWKEELSKQRGFSPLRKVIEGPSSLASRRHWLLQVVAATSGSWLMIEQCVNKFRSWLSDWRLPLVFFLFQKTRCTCSSSYFVSPTASVEDITCSPPPGRLGLCLLSAASHSFRRPLR